MKKILGFYLILITSCSSQQLLDKNIDIVIEEMKSYKYDLKNGIFTIFYLSKLPTKIKFNLTNKEQNEIIKSYYSLNLNKIKTINKQTGNIYIEDECMTMPKNYTILHVKTKSLLQEIQIDMGCDNFYLSNFREANRIKKFIKLVLNIIQSKPEMKNAPGSDILYM